MPNKDGTGPKGDGPLTGRKQGNCNKDGESLGNQGSGKGRGRGANCGRGKGGLGRCGRPRQCE